MARRITLALLFVLGGAATTPADDWHTDPDAARRLAATEKKDLFLLFTGTAWCGACIKFESQVLGKPEFIAGTTEFVRVKLEFPGSEGQLPPDRRDSYIAWRDRHGIRAYPTVVLADPDGRPYAITGFGDETNPVDFVHKIDRLSPVRDRRDKALDRAARSQGLDKAQALDEALGAVRGASDPSLVVYQGELLTRFYRPLIDEVIALDPDNAAGLRNRYLDLLASDDEHTHLTQLNDRLNRVVKDEGAKAALALFDVEMAHAPSPDFRSKLIVSKLYLLESDKRFEEAWALADKLAVDATRPLDERRSLRIKAAYLLVRLDRVDEAVAVYDDLIARAGDDRQQVLRTLLLKGNTFFRRRPEEALRAFEQAKSISSPGSTDWFDLELTRLRVLRLMGRFDEALRGFDEVLALPTLPATNRVVCLADKAMAHGLAGRRDMALKLAEEVDAALPQLGLVEQSSTVQFVQAMLKIARSDPASKQP